VNVVIWVVQVLVGLAFAFSGIMKLTQPRAKLQQNMAYLEDFSDNQTKGIGAVELLGALGVILPAWTGIAPILTPIAAVGLMIVMLLAALTHVRRKEYSSLGINAVLFLLVAIVAWARFGPYSY
jgi:uncharacterized membrane protein YphA (DoxX/SURF4 family)